MSAYVQLDKANLYFPVSEESEVLAETDTSNITEAILEQQSTIANLELDLTTAKDNTTYEQVQIEGLEEISTVIEEKIITLYNKLRTETFNETYNKIIELKEKQEAKDRAILDAYHLALDAQEAMKKRHEAYENYQSQIQSCKNYYSNPDASRTEIDMAEGVRDSARRSYQEYNRQYNVAEEKAIDAYRKARDMEPNKSGDYSMTSV